jgi:hypothetical protein
VVFNFSVDRVSLFDTIEPRPVSVPIEIQPRPVKHRGPREIAPKGIVEQDGPTQADILLEAIVLVARKPQTVATRGALRNLIARFSCECGLGF